jgi:hypothetical protein
MTTNPDDTKNSATSEPCELPDDELNAVSGGIIIVSGKPAVSVALNIGSASSGAGAGKVTFNPFST